jgi:serine/threonine protein kinase
LFTGRPVGPYVAQEVIGRGGMAEVYRAVAEGSAGSVAIKVLNPSALENPDHVERFLREAKVSSELESDHIVRVLESGVSADGYPFLAMELLEGSNLARFLRQHNRLPVADVVDLVEQLAQALSVAQSAGIVHRDLKPQNVFRTELAGRAHWKLLDFGASKLQAASATLTHGAAIGTPSYMSPEQVRGDEIDHRADVFSLGSIAYRALTGQPAFSGPDPMSIMYQVHNAQPIRPSALVELPADVDSVLCLALAKDPKRRLASAPEFARALADAAAGELSKDLRARALALEADHPWRVAVVPQSLD